MKIEQHIPAIEALLFASGDGVTVSRIAGSLDISESVAKAGVEALQQRMAQQGSGLEIIRLDDGYQMVSKSKYAPGIRKLLEIRRNTPLSGAAFEVLSVIAYNQPVTKAYVEQVRGVDCTGVIGSLSAKGLIEESGRLDLPGRPLLYSTTQNFLRCFSLDSLGDLPPIPQPEQDDAQQSVEETQMEEFVTEE